jgi:hypothetical protein
VCWLPSATLSHTHVGRVGSAGTMLPLPLAPTHGQFVLASPAPLIRALSLSHNRSGRVGSAGTMLPLPLALTHGQFVLAPARTTDPRALSLTQQVWACRLGRHDAPSPLAHSHDHFVPVRRPNSSALSLSLSQQVWACRLGRHDAFCPLAWKTPRLCGSCLPDICTHRGPASLLPARRSRPLSVPPVSNVRLAPVIRWQAAL